MLSLKTLAFLNMRVTDVININEAYTNSDMYFLGISKPPQDLYLLNAMILEAGRDWIVDQLCRNEDTIAKMWERSNNHICNIQDFATNISCWCACDKDPLRTCTCLCMHILFILIDVVDNEIGFINYNNQVKHALFIPHF